MSAGVSYLETTATLYVFAQEARRLGFIEVADYFEKEAARRQDRASPPRGGDGAGAASDFSPRQTDDNAAVGDTAGPHASSAAAPLPPADEAGEPTPSHTYMLPMNVEAAIAWFDKFGWESDGWEHWSAIRDFIHEKSRRAQPIPGAGEGRDDFAPLMKFYYVDTVAELVTAQERHIKKLQAKLSPPPDPFPQNVREG